MSRWTCLIAMKLKIILQQYYVVTVEMITEGKDKMLSDLTVTDWDTVTGHQCTKWTSQARMDVAVVFCVLVKPLVTRWRHSVVMAFSFILTSKISREYMQYATLKHGLPLAFTEKGCEEVAKTTKW